MTHSARSISLIVLQEVKESCCWGAVAFNSEMELLLFLLLAAIPEEYFFPITLLSVLIAVVFEGTPGLTVTSNSITGSEGGSASVSCQYAQHYTEHVKYWCRGREWASCETLVRTDTPQTEGEKVSISDDKGKLPRFFTVTVRRLEKKDAGWYWCAIQKAGANERILLYLTVTDTTTIKTTTHTTISMSTADESSTKQQTWTQNTTAIPPNNIPGNATGSTTQRLEITTSTFSDSGSTQVALMVAIGILVFFLVIAVICIIKYIQIKQGKVRKVSQQEDVDQRVDSPAPTGQPAGGEITYTAVTFQKKKQTRRKEKPPRILGEATTYATLEFQKRDSPTGDRRTVCNAQPSDAASALYAAVVKRPNRP
ncbi:CMRF35-like molecule 3 [Huso huso]|uniref:CMRF35-like molecule 3 n=1 Tax=Huso huso TaxID=61971 RepID=A0ABR1A014_HUSHU